MSVEFADKLVEIEELAEKIELNDFNGEFEIAHRNQDELTRKVLGLIADGCEYSKAKWLAKKALRISSMDFPRWYSGT